MKFLTTTLLLTLLIGTVSAQGDMVMKYDLDLTKNLDTLFVTLNVDGKLAEENSIFQFAATAPGTYQTMNIGRFISDFKAFDKKGKEIQVSNPSVNQYKLSKAKKVKTITYKVAETFDTQVSEYPIYLMCGSSLEEDHTLLNAHTFMGYFEGLQKAPISLSIKHDQAWKSGSALLFEEGAYQANDFDHAVDSPILLGDLTVADTTVSGTKIEIYTYSQNDKLNSSLLLSEMSAMLDAASKFLVKLPVDNYTFLYHFEPNQPGTTGAWEHSYSSEYVLNENDPTPEYLSRVTDIASHEFFHIVTPLNIHSEIIESFNFVSPTPSVHLWMYEGVTEWASNILLYRGEVIDLESYLANAVARKIVVDENYFDTSWSLKKLADESFNGGEGARQYGNIYFRGSLVAGLLDIKLLELSEGEMGLRELMLTLVDEYGKGKPVSEETFFDDIVAMTYPEIRTFFDKYVLSNEPLPHQEYLKKIGLQVSGEGNNVRVTKMKKTNADQDKLFEAWSKNKTL